jgi:hypothetical protein
MSDSPGTYRSDDYGGGTSKIKQFGHKTVDNYVRPQQIPGQGKLFNEPRPKT